MAGRSHANCGPSTGRVYPRRYYYVKDDILYCKILSGKKILKFRNFSKKFIKSSNGEGSERYKVTLRVIIDGHEVVGKFSLNSRESMNYPILIGKNIIKKGFVVDVDEQLYMELQKIERA
jgi:acetyltransferase-like isoleucine patch superfamily enzyme